MTRYLVEIMGRQYAGAADVTRLGYDTCEAPSAEEAAVEVVDDCYRDDGSYLCNVYELGEPEEIRVSLERTVTVKAP